MTNNSDLELLKAKEKAKADHANKEAETELALEQLGDAAYSASSIKVLKGLEAVRKRPGMYIGDTDDGSGLHHMVYEVVDNAIDEALAGYCNQVLVMLNPDGSVTVEDNGRGIPVDIHESEGISAAEVIMTQLHAGGKFDQNSYKVSGGLHGVGVSVVNALSDWLTLIIWRDGFEYSMEFKNGDSVAPLQKVGDADGKRGTKVTFHPSREIFSFTEFSFATLEHRLRELSFLNSGVRIVLKDLREEAPKESVLAYEGGIKSYVEYLDKSKNPLHQTITIAGPEINGISMELAMQWNDSYYENVLCFTNNIRQKDGGTHLAGMRAALTRIINNYASENKLFKKEKIVLTGEDVREGLTAILSVKVPDPKFSSQTKEKLVSSEVRTYVEAQVNDKLNQWFEEKPADARLIVNKGLEAALAQLAARRARELTRKKSSLEINSLSGKLADCQDKDPETTELFIVEGNSAGGSAKSGRNRKYQAILPIRGKILNVERARLDKMLASAEIGTIITALGTSIGEEFDISKTRYHKIIIMADADVDGSHIRTLLLTFFFRYMPKIIEKGYLYIAQPPLYKVKRGHSEVYLKNEQALHNHVIDNALEGAVLRSSVGDRAGNDLLDFVSKISRFNLLIGNVSRLLSPVIAEAFALLGGFGSDWTSSKEASQEIAEALVQKLQSEDVKWLACVTEAGVIELVKEARGVKSSITLDKSLLALPEADLIEQLRAQVAADFAGGLSFIKKDEKYEIEGIAGLISLINEIGKKGLSIQRFKGLGEMNAEQLWQTTLDPANRTLLQVRIEQFDAADETFSILMGNVVEPRRDFIQENALKVVNLDA